MPPITENNPQDVTEAFKIPTIGIIYPPPELRNIVDKTAGFVARNGPDFEARIRQNEINNAKFNFLNPGDPYHAYYQHKVKEIKEGKGQEEVQAPPAPPSNQVVAQAKLPAPVPQQKPEIVRMIEPKIVPKDPPKEFEYIVDPPSISGIELDIVKLTAQFVARNGKNFQTNLMNREQRNFQFDFLRPQHSLFPYFRKLVEQYTKILIPDDGFEKELSEQTVNPEKVLDDVRYRVEWIKLQESEKRKREEDEERERVQYAQIDWHDFTIVETVDYLPSEQGNFPPPTTPQEVGTRALLQQRLESEEIDVEMEVEDSDEEEASKKIPSTPANMAPHKVPPQEMLPPPPVPPIPEKVVVKNFNPSQQKRPLPAASQQKFLISPITGERVPADKMEEHMRIGLLDPRWVEQRDKQIQEKMTQEEVFAQGSSIESSLKHFAERRTDIFGQEETAIGLRVGEEEEEKQPERPIWDGHLATAESVARQARANITVEQQIQQIHKMKGLVADDDKEKIGPAKPGGNRPPQSSQSSSGIPPPQARQSAPPGLHQTGPPGIHQSGPPGIHQTGPPGIHQAPPPGLSQAPPGLSQAPPPGISAAIHQAPPPGVHPPPPPQVMVPRPPIMAPLIMAPNPSIMMIPQPPSFVPVMSVPSAIPPPPQPQQDEIPPGEEPTAKKAKTEDQLIPEEDFLRTQPEVIAVRVAVPHMTDKPEWRLNGQIASINVPLRETFGALKSRIQEITGMPPGKQKLVYDGIFVKDNNSLAFYNVITNGIVQLQLKERGGRKK